MTGWSVHLCPLPVCDPFVAAESLAWWELGLCRGLTPSHCCSLSARKFHFVTTSSPLMTHNVMLNVIRPRRRASRIQHWSNIHDTHAQQIFGEGELEIYLPFSHFCWQSFTPVCSVGTIRHRRHREEQTSITSNTSVFRERERERERERYIHWVE